MLKFIVLALVLSIANRADAAVVKHPIVLELFTSQSCSSCPPADALMQKLQAEDNSLLPLLFHIDYWDRLGWKDTYSSHEYTDRQNSYATAMGLDGIFTPQLIVNGVKSVNGSDGNNVNQAISEAKKTLTSLNISITPNADKLQVLITSKNSLQIDSDLDILQIQFDPYAEVSIPSGENGGRTLETVNNVTSIKSLGTWHKGEIKNFSLDKPTAGVAIIAQAPGPREIYGAATYITQK